MPRYLLLVHPSANRVYAREAPRVAAAELRALAHLTGCGVEEVAEETRAGVPYIRFDAPGWDGAARDVASNASAAYAAFAVVDERLAPVPLAPRDQWDDDLLTIQRYPGKTNEQFTRLLLNLAVAAASGAEGFAWNARLRVLDPLCGRGTTLNHAVMYGYDAFGIDIDRRDVEAYTSFFTQWLQDKRAKHTVQREGGAVPKWTVEFAHDKQGRRAGQTQRVTVAVGDTAEAGRLFRGVDAVVTDLPYGVQHGSTAGTSLSRDPLELLAAALPAWIKALRPGGGLVLSWNVRVMSRDAVVATLAEAGADVLLDGESWDFRHRVDRAVVRDLVVARKPS